VKDETNLKEGFIWGVASSSYQVEGSITADGRGASIWDSFCKKPGCVRNGDSGDVACDSYRRWPDDIELLKELGVGAYRFSIAWPRVQPTGTGKPNQAGLDYYRRLADAVRAAGIEPWAALYHWDLPQTLEDAGGWPARDTALRFADYAALCFEALGTSIHTWITFNEPWCSAFLGYGSGEHAPGKRDQAQAYAAAHHLLLAHGMSVQRFRNNGATGSIGIVINPAKPRPATSRAADKEASVRASVQRTGLWLDPLFNRKYPEEHLRDNSVHMPVQAGDMDTIASPIDFIGVNYYNEDAVRAVPKNAANPEGFAFVPTWQPKTAMGWDVEPKGLHRILKFMSDTWPIPALYVTENGAAYDHTVDADGRLHDRERIVYYQGHIAAMEEAIADGVPLNGYFAWTLMDNFEWSFGYDKLFGMVAVDRTTGLRTRKDSFYYYRDTVAGYRSWKD